MVGILITATSIVLSANSPKTEEMQKATAGKQTYYLIVTEKQLTEIGKGKYKMSYHYVLNADIALTKEWTAIGDDRRPFTGSFNGNGFTISNLKITNKKAKYIGLFGYVEGGTVYNVTLKNENIDSAGSKGMRVGAVVAICLDGKVYNNVVM